MEKGGDSRAKVSPQCRGNDGILILGSLAQGDFLLLRSGQRAKFRTPVYALGIGLIAGY